ncbi:uncharacterized protein C8A04DRAFT_12463 [Dichotomopilus funicola]|uniref:BHLH domain-containing protein n=1 Tax=Dichotomopilus funicola TaxID=1934379 RepID=A0AAN6V3E4_9PEZI|nr:hypothetical protein C8A04DRAFT_12463 [Dichotomopilus funicola]
MQSTPAAAPQGYSPDLDAEGSFPERHLDDDKVVPGPSPAAGPRRFHAGTPNHRLAFEPSLPTVYARDWPGPNQTLPLDTQVWPHGPLPDPNLVPAPYQQATTPLLQPEWSSFRNQHQDGLSSWPHSHTEMSLDDDSDSIQSDFSLTMSTLSSQRPRRTSSHRVSKPLKAPSPIPGHHPAVRVERPYIPDFDYSTDWLDPDSAAAFFPTATHDPATAAAAAAAATGTTGAEIEVAYRDGSSSAKVDSKRIAHKLSEKTRRNRLTIAIREIQKLLPSGLAPDDESSSQAQKDADYIVRPGVPSSKLDIVEMAVGFIRDLKERNKDLAKRLREAEKQLETCRCQVAAGKQPAGSSLSLPAMDETAG